MTIETDNMYINNENNVSTKMSQALRDTLTRAKEQRRIICGVYDAAQLMEKNPDTVMMCIMIEGPKVSDVSDNIHFTLMEAYCWENEIRLIKVDSALKLANILGDIKPKRANDNDCRPLHSEDLNCLLIEYPAEADDFTDAEDDVLEYYKALCNHVPIPVIALPV